MLFRSQPAFSPTRLLPLRALVGGKSFARKRLAYSIELTGSCMLMAAFLVLVLLA